MRNTRENCKVVKQSNEKFTVENRKDKSILFKGSILECMAFLMCSEQGYFDDNEEVEEILTWKKD